MTSTFWNVVAYKLCIKWFIFTFSHILSLNPFHWFSYILEHMPTYFFTSTAVRQRACFYQNHSIKFCFNLMTCCCFHVLPAQPFTYTLSTVSQFDITIFKGDWNTRLFIDYFFIPCYNIQLFFDSSTRLVPVFNARDIAVLNKNFMHIHDVNTQCR